MFAFTKFLRAAAAGLLLSILFGALFCGTAAMGLSLFLPGLNLTLPGPVVAGCAGATVGALLGLPIGLLIGITALIISAVTGGGKASDGQQQNSQSQLFGSVVLGALLALVFGIIGFIIGGFLGIGTNVMLPGLGLVISGSLFSAIAFAGFAIIIGALLGLAAGFLIRRTRQRSTR